MACVCGCMMLAAGCGGSQQAQTGFLSDYSKLEKESDNILRYVNKPALPRYSRFIIDHPEVYFYSGAKGPEAVSKGKITKQHMADLQNYMHEAMVSALRDGGYEVVYQPGPGVARMRMAITDIEKTNVVAAGVPHTRLAGVGLGGAAMEAEVIDTQTGEQIAAVVQSRSGSRIPFTDLANYGGAHAAMRAWANRVVRFLDEAHGR